MNRSLFRILTVFLLLMLPVLLAAQKTEQSFLLWRISGNGLAKPSYLYGTMHLKDKKLFHFPDSLYAALENTDGFAMELHPDSMVQALIENNTTTEYLSKLLKPADFARIKKKLAAEFKEKPERVTLADLETYCSARYYKIEAENSMNTFMDSYLYGTAARLEKWTGGIEDVADQFEMFGRESPESTAEEFLLSDQIVRKRMDAMIDGYLKEEEHFTSVLQTDSIMIRRNHKMAKRMDSLMNIRTMLFAVGVGHLGGVEGVVKLLQQKGYSVEPVVNTKRKYILEHHFNFKEIPWVTVKEKNGLYTAQMPGVPPKEYNIPGTDNGVKVYVDLKTGLVYFSFVSPALANLTYDSLVKNMVKFSEVKLDIKSSKQIKNGEFEGREIVAGTKNEVMKFQMFILDGFAYGVFVAYAPSSLVVNEDILRFFNSFSIKRPSSEILADRLPRQYTSMENGFSVQLPVKPVIKRDLVTRGVMWQYFALDMKNEAGYVTIVNRLGPGMNFIDDSLQLSEYPEILHGRENTRVISERKETVKGYPANWIDFKVAVYSDSLYYRALNLVRGARSYIFVSYAKSLEALNPLAENFFNSLSFLKIASEDWSMHNASEGNFQLWSPGPLTKDTLYNKMAHIRRWLTTDTLSSVSFQVLEVDHDSLLRISSDTAYLREKMMSFIEEGELPGLSFEFKKNGDFLSAEVLSKLPNSHTHKKIRGILSSRALILLLATGEKESLVQTDVQKMYDSFKPSGTADLSELYKSKADKVIAALDVEKTVETSDGSFSKYNYNWTNDELPLLYKAMSNQRETNYYSSVLSIIRRIEDTSSIAVLGKMYDQLPAGNDSVKMEILSSLVTWKTERSHQIVVDKLLSNPPVNGYFNRIFYGLDDSAALAIPYFHKLMPLMSDSNFTVPVVSFATRLVQRKHIPAVELQPYKKQMYDLAGKVAALKANDDENNFWQYSNLYTILAYLKEPAAIAALKKLLTNANTDVKFGAVSSLLSLKQSIPAAELLKIAADKSNRFDLYDTLAGAKKLSLYPAQYLNQKSFGESSIYWFMDDSEYALKSMTYIGERVTTYNKKKQKFFLYKVTVEGEEEQEQYLGITGPYSLLPNAKLVKFGDADTVLTEEKYNPAKLDSALKKYLKEMEEYYKNRE